MRRRHGSSAAAAGERVDGAFLRRYCPQTLEAIDRIAGWVAN